MNKTAVIWRKSVYDTNCCPSCGTRLIDKDNQPDNCIVCHTDNGSGFQCGKCGNLVAFLRPYYGDVAAGERAGEWKDDQHENQ